MGWGAYYEIAFGSVFGYLLQRAGLCTVAAMSHFVSGRGTGRLFGISTVVAWAAIPLLVYAVVVPAQSRLAANPPLAWPMFAGAILLGVGSAVNGGCFVGSVARATAGDSNWLATFVGMALASSIVRSVSTDTPVPFVVTRAVAPDQVSGLRAALLLVIAFGVGAVYFGWRRHRMRGVGAGRPRTLLHAAVGIAAALIFIRIPAWSYAAALDDVVRRGPSAPWWGQHAVAIAMFGGSAVSAVVGSSFRWVAPQPALVARRLLGGGLMAFGAHWVPGGNDILLLWAIPSLAIYGAVAYALMTGSIAVVIRIGAAASKRRLGPGNY